MSEREVKLFTFSEHVKISGAIHKQEPLHGANPLDKFGSAYPDCTTCIYSTFQPYDDAEDDFTVCRRYPEEASVEQAYVCGEYLGEGNWSESILDKVLKGKKQRIEK